MSNLSIYSTEKSSSFIKDEDGDMSSFSGFLRSEHVKELSQEEHDSMMSISNIIEDISVDPEGDVTEVSRVFDESSNLVELIGKLRKFHRSADYKKVHYQDMYCSILWVFEPSKRDSIRHWVQACQESEEIIQDIINPNKPLPLYYKGKDGVFRKVSMPNGKSKALYYESDSLSDSPTYERVKLGPEYFSRIPESPEGLPERSLMKRYLFLLGTRRFEVNNEYVLFWAKKKCFPPNKY